MENQIEFNYETYLEGKHKLVTRGGEMVARVNVKAKDKFLYPYCYELEGNIHHITSTGKINLSTQSQYDLFMIPIQTDETIPFDLEKFKSGEWDVLTEGGTLAIHSRYLGGLMNHVVCIYDKSYGLYDKNLFNLLRLRKKPITPFTHPHLYEVSYDNTNWINIKKYYDNIEENVDAPHKILTINGNARSVPHLRTKQPTEITKDQAFDAVANLESVKEKLTEKFGEFKIR